MKTQVSIFQKLFQKSTLSCIQHVTGMPHTSEISHIWTIIFLKEHSEFLLVLNTEKLLLFNAQILNETQIPTFVYIFSNLANKHLQSQHLNKYYPTQPCPPLRRQQRHLSEQHERPLQLRRHSHLGPPPSTSTGPIRCSLSQPRSRVLPSGLL